MPIGVYVRSPVRSRWKHGQELIDLQEASKILFLSITGLHWQIRKKGALKLQEFYSCRWWVLKSDVLELKVRREKKAQESAEASHRQHLIKMQEWHTMMTKESRCHWCGVPALKEFKNACPKHIKATRIANQRSKARIKAQSRAEGLCASCNRRPRRYGYETCAVCALKGAMAARERRNATTLKRVDSLVDIGLIDVDETAEILGIHRVRVHNLIKKGLLKVRRYAFRRFYLSEDDVCALKKTLVGSPLRT